MKKQFCPFLAWHGVLERGFHPEGKHQPHASRQRQVLDGLCVWVGATHEPVQALGRGNWALLRRSHHHSR